MKRMAHKKTGNTSSKKVIVLVPLFYLLKIGFLRYISYDSVRFNELSRFKLTSKKS